MIPSDQTIDERHGAKTAFEVIDSAVDEFEAILATYNIKVRPGSQLEHACLILKDFKTRRQQILSGKPLGEWPEIQQDVRLALGVLNLAQLVIMHQRHPEFGRFVPHLELLNGGMPAQTARSVIVDDASNKIFELRLALACLGTSTNVRIDDPVSSSGGTNPDVMCRMSDGRDWGLACKVLYGSNPNTFADRLREGVDQIERSPADTGFVCVSLRNLLPHELFLPVTGQDVHGGPIFVAHRSVEALRESASRHLVARVSEMVRSIGLAELEAIFRGRKAVAAVVIPVDVVGLVLRDGQPVMSMLSFLHVVQFNELGLPNSFDGRAERVASALNDHLALREGD